MAKKEKRSSEESTTLQGKAIVGGENSFFKRNFYQVIIFAFSFLLFANSIPNGYNLDDELVTRNHRLTSKGITAIPEIFTSTYYQDGQGYAYEYRPVVLSTFAVEHSFFGDSPTVSHFFNVLLYSCFCVLLFNVFKQLFPAINPVFFLIVTLLFTAHPSHTEVVDNIKSRDEILAFLFSILALRMGLRYVQETTDKKWLWVALMFVMFTLALFNKLTIISFAIIIPFTLILFASATLTQVVVISVLLIAPSLLLVNIPNFVQKVAFGSLLFVANISFYVFINRSKFFSLFKSGYSAASVANNEVLQTLSIPGTGFKPLFQGLLPSREIWSFKALALPLVLFSAFAFGLFFQLMWLYILCGILLICLPLFSGKAISWWATLFFYIAAVGLLFQFPVQLTIYNSLLSVVLAYQIFFGRRDFAIPAAFLYLSLLLVTLKLSPVFSNQGDAVGYLLALALLRNRYTKYLAPVGIIAGIATQFQQSPFFAITNNYVGWVFLTILVGVHLLRINGKYFAVVFKSLCLLFIVCWQLNQGWATFGLPQTDALLANVKTSIIPGTQNRPLDFVEQPVNNQSPLSIRVGTSAEILFHYFYKTILPYPMAAYYGYKFIVPMPVTAPLSLAGLMIFLVLVGIAVWQLNKDKIIGYWLLFYIVSLVVFSNFLIPVPGQLADRFMFVPSLAWCFLAVWLGFKLIKLNPMDKVIAIMKLPAVPKLGLAALLLLYSGITFARNFEWKDTITLFSHDIGYVNNSAQAHNLLALYLAQQATAEKNFGDAEKLQIQAAEHFAKALEIYPQFMNASFDLGRTNSVLAAFETQANNPTAAAQYYSRAVNAFKQTIHIDPNFTDAYFQLAIALDQSGKLDEAEPYYRHVINKQPLNVTAYTNLSFIYYRQKKTEQSIAVNKQANMLMPKAYEPMVNIAKTYLSLDNADSALVWLEKAYTIDQRDKNLVQTIYDVTKRKGLAKKSNYYGRLLGINN